jgi:hypothetical protein
MCETCGHWHLDRVMCHCGCKVNGDPFWIREYEKRTAELAAKRP